MELELRKEDLEAEIAKLEKQKADNSKVISEKEKLQEMNKTLEPKRQELKLLKKELAKAKNIVLNTEDSMLILQSYGINGKSIQVKKGEDPADALMRHNAASKNQKIDYPLVVKILSDDEHASHKSDIGGVILKIKNDQELREAVEKVYSNVRNHNIPEEAIQGVQICEFVEGKHEMCAGVNYDSASGLHMIEIGLGGVEVDVTNKLKGGTAATILPLTNKPDEDIDTLIKKSPVYAYFKPDANCKAYRGMKPANTKFMREQLNDLAKITGDMPFVTNININPFKIREIDENDPKVKSNPELLKKQSEIVAVDARILIDYNKAKECLYQAAIRMLISSCDLKSKIGNAYFPNNVLKGSFAS